MTDIYRVGRKLGRTIYFHDDLIGLMDTEEWAREVVRCLNQAALVSGGRSCALVGCMILGEHSHDDDAHRRGGER